MRNLSIDILKIVLAFFVVFLHMHLFQDTRPVLGFVLVNGVFRMAVPTFLIITGYYFYYVDNTQKLKKWLIRTFLLYLIWSLVYIPFWKKEDIFINILFGYHHLWYLIGTFFFSDYFIFNQEETGKVYASAYCFIIQYRLRITDDRKSPLFWGAKR
ncbi:acyltransferase family protein [Chryseobacterium proteolyticum]|uniref:acyltransferase family protein n=1 Tax=Chryseobacterium proteolyticum TaxID=118127 RepID=UPI003983CA26